MKGRYSEFRKYLDTHLMALDGSMGALLQKRGLPAGYAPDLWNLEKPEIIYQVHAEYAKAGADILITNTFGASRLRLAEYGADNRISEINEAAVKIARKAGGSRCFVAGDIGPTGDTVFPTGKMLFAEAKSIFKEQVSILVNAGVDLIIVETMFDSLEFKAALSAIREVSNEVPVIALMTFGQDAISDTGISPESTVAIAEGFHVDVVGANCSVGPEAMLEVVKRMKAVSNIPICIQPNAGIPKLSNNQTCFPLDANAMAEFIIPFFMEGVRVLGGCCGTTPEYIQFIRKTIDEKQRALFVNTKVEKKQRVLISSKSNVLQIGNDYPFALVGEKINPTGRKKVAEKIRQGDVESLLKDGLMQLQAGAMALDVNVGVPLIDEPKMMQTVVCALQNAVDIPLVIDSSFTTALASGSEVYYGRPLLNSINAEDEKIQEMLPIIQQSGGAIIALTTGTEVPEKASDRFKYAQKILKHLEQVGLDRNDVVFDVLALTVSAMRSGSIETLKLVQMIREELGCATIFGCSNSSFGLPNRKFVHQSYLTMAIQKGLSSAIVNVLERDVPIRVAAAELFSPRKNAINDYLQNWSQPVKEMMQSVPEGLLVGEDLAQDPTVKMKLDALEREIFWDVVDGKLDKIKTDIEEFLQTHQDKAFNLFLNVMTPGIRYLGDLFGQRKRFIPHLVSAAESMKEGVRLLEPYLLNSERNAKKQGTIVFATVKGDIHDIGKNICVMMLKNFGYEIIDMGRNVPMEDIFAKAIESKAQIIALSALMTTTMVQMKLLVEENRKRGYGFKVMVGGAPVTSEFAKEIGADGYSDDVGVLAQETDRLLRAMGYQVLN